MRALKTLVILVSLLALWGCATQPPAPVIHAGDLPELEVTQKAHYVSEGSLYAESGAADLVSDFRARHVGDILTVQVVESSLGSSSADSSLKKDSSNKLEAPVLFGWENKIKGHLGPDFDPSLAFQTGSSKEFTGEGATTRKQSLSASIAVRVMAVGTGGRMLIAGTKKITVNQEKQTLTLAGIVRPEDVGPNNTITSNSIADLSVHYGGKGDINDVTRQGWFQRLLSKIWPF